jgi:hypothetical protein
VPHALLVLPSAFNAQVGGFVTVSKNGRELTLTAAVGACTGQPLPRVAAQVYETAGAVVVGTRVTYGASSSGMCAGIEMIERFRATLARPLGSRVVLDVGSGQPLANDSQVNGAWVLPSKGWVLPGYHRSISRCGARPAASPRTWPVGTGTSRMTR